MVGIGKVKETLIHVVEPPILEICGNDQKKVFEIDKDGKVFWLKNGKYTQAKMDIDLALAFMVVILSQLGYSYEALIEKIREGGKI